MRCYFVQKGHLADVQYLTTDTDESLIEQGEALFHQRSSDRAFDGFEIWHGARLVHIHPKITNVRNSN
jgi:hypothetical protein